MRQNFSRLDCSIHEAVSTYTSVSITKGLWIFTDQKIISMCLWRGSVKFSRSLSDCRDPVQSKIDPLPLLQLRSDHPPILQHYANQNPKLRVPPEPSNTFSIALWTPNNLRKPHSHFCLHLSSSFRFSPLELQIRCHVFVFSFHLSIFNILNCFSTLTLSF